MRISLATVKVLAGVEEESMIFLRANELSIALREVWWEESGCEGICRRSGLLQLC